MVGAVYYLDSFTGVVGKVEYAVCEGHFTLGNSGIFIAGGYARISESSGFCTLCKTEGNTVKVNGILGVCNSPTFSCLNTVAGSDLHRFIAADLKISVLNVKS